MRSYLSAVILAGGQSRRMGRDKALLPIALRSTTHGGEATSPQTCTSVVPKEIDPWATETTTLLQRTCAVAKLCTDSAAITSSNRVFVLSAIPYHLPWGCQWIAEDPPHQGPLKAFARCLAQIESEWILLLACDLPYLDAQVLQRWIKDLPQVPANSIAYLVPHRKGWECLCGFYRSNCQQSLAEFVAAGGDSFQVWLQDQQVQAMPAPEPKMLINWNSPADLAT
jgi:molybdenum cofactor guanylyltransferase